MSVQLIDAKGRSHDVETAKFHEPIAMIWLIDLSLIDDLEPLSGKCEVRLHGATWSGMIVPGYSGSWGGRCTVRVVAGHNGWGKAIDRKGYHSDSGVKPKTVAGDAATACGETLGSFDTDNKLPADYARPTGLASVTLEDVIGDASWWVDRAGVTHVGTRSAKDYAGLVLDWDPGARRATLECEDLTALEVGARIIDSRFSEPQQIRELEIVAEGANVRAYAWCGSVGTPMGRIPRLITAIVERIMDGKLWGKYEYRVVGMAPDGRVNLQVDSKVTGLPDLLPVTMRPGVSGAFAKLNPGSKVLVEFINGERGRPIVTGFAGKSMPGFAPTSLSFLEGTRPAAGVGDQVTIFMTPGTPVAISGTLSGAPFVGTAVFDAPLMGVISTGTPLMEIP